MTEPQDFESLDELFRKTFDNLPENASPSGWDRPSERVWQHIQTTVQPPRSGWSTRTITLVSALAVTIVIGLYLFISRPVQPVETVTPAQPDTPATAVVETPAISETAVPTTTTTPPAPKPAHVVVRKKQVTAQQDTPAPKPAVAEPVTNQRPSGSIPLPGSTVAPPNNTIEKLERLWKTPLETLPVLPEKIEDQQ